MQVVRQAHAPLPGARADWQILTELGAPLNQDWAYSLARATFWRDRARRADLRGLSRGAVGESGVRWPRARARLAPMARYRP